MRVSTSLRLRFLPPLGEQHGISQLDGRYKFSLVCPGGSLRAHMPETPPRGRREEGIRTKCSIVLSWLLWTWRGSLSESASGITALLTPSPPPTTMEETHFSRLSRSSNSLRPSVQKLRPSAASSLQRGPSHTVKVGTQQHPVLLATTPGPSCPPLMLP